jgi:hypothetical protein
LQRIQKKCAALRQFTARFGLVLALAVASGACKPVTEAEAPAPGAQTRFASSCGDTGNLRTELYGAVALRIDWGANDFECIGMSRPDGKGARLRFAGVAGDDAQRIAIIIAIPDLRRAEDGREFATNVTLIEEGGGRFFSTPDLDNCLTDITALDPLDESGNRYSIGGVLYCVSPLPEVNGETSVSIPELRFVGLVDWSTS